MSIKTRSYQIGIDADKNKNFVLKPPPIPDGSIALYRGNVDDLGDKVWEVDAQGNFKAKTIHLGEPVAMAGKTFHDFPVPEGAKRVILMPNKISTNGPSSISVKLGTSGGIVTTGYESQLSIIEGGALSATYSGSEILIDGGGASFYRMGALTLYKIDGNNWVGSGCMGVGGAPSARTSHFGSSVTLLSPLLTVRLTTVNGTDQFDAGTANISWEY